MFFSPPSLRFSNLLTCSACTSYRGNTDQLHLNGIVHMRPSEPCSSLLLPKSFVFSTYTVSSEIQFPWSGTFHILLRRRGTSPEFDSYCSCSCSPLCVSGLICPQNCSQRCNELAKLALGNFCPAYLLAVFSQTK